MKTQKIPAGVFKAKCLGLLDEVETRQIELIITKRGKPVARLVCVESKPFSLYGCMKNSVVIRKDIVESTGETWEADE